MAKRPSYFVHNGTAPCSQNSNDSSSSDSELYSANGSPGLMYVSGSGMPSLSLTLLVVTALLLKRKMYQHKRLILILLTTSVLFGVFYIFWLKPFTVSDRVQVQALQKHLKKVDCEKKMIERRNRMIERKLREMIRGVMALLNHRTFDPDLDQCPEGERLCQFPEPSSSPEGSQVEEISEEEEEEGMISQRESLAEMVRVTTQDAGLFDFCTEQEQQTTPDESSLLWREQCKR
ncbi:uncharacterized protein LOC115458693 [Microcaecilia unicolor]|uniref:Uncharacterized protein LOC115458693 n=1 Tax=Microcaecilia unicolor TaxID=1415580 RepID=A0A6P7WT64_9AMPH|nr:uncharacterized protein LOC115458693 [Microcaecilia unicolor]